MGHTFSGSAPHQKVAYTPIGRTNSQYRVRVVAGRLGAGKSLYLRMMRKEQVENKSVFAEAPTRNLSDLSTADVIMFARRSGEGGANTEAWKLLWQGHLSERSILRAT